jgi:hypothetical protein
MRGFIMCIVSPVIVKMVKYHRMRWVGCVAHIAAIIKWCTGLIAKSGEKRLRDNRSILENMP